jgi:hypothetical protein
MPRTRHRARRATVATVLLPAILLLQLSCECAPAHAASAAHVGAAAHGCCSGSAHPQAPAPQNHQQDHQTACGHCHLTLAASSAQVSASRVAGWSGLFTPAPSVDIGAPRTVALVSLTADRIAFDTSRLRTSVLLL